MPGFASGVFDLVVFEDCVVPIATGTPANTRITPMAQFASMVTSVVSCGGAITTGSFSHFFLALPAAFITSTAVCPECGIGIVTTGTLLHTIVI